MTIHHIHTPSASSITNSQSIRSQRGGQSTRKLEVVTAPPWARDEPPSPKEQIASEGAVTLAVGPHPSVSKRSASSDALSYSSTRPPDGAADGPSWWTFTRKGHNEGPPPLRIENRQNSSNVSPKHGKLSRIPLVERSRTWLSQRRLSHDSPQEEAQANSNSEEGHRNRWDLHIPLPSATGPYTLAHTRTPGWESPWSPRIPGQSILHVANGGDQFSNGSGYIRDADGFHEDPDALDGKSKWYRRRKRLRVFVLSNNYVPLLFRVINITFTTAALAIAIQIRKIEQRYGVLGAVGSSPTLVIIFAPLTLVHVMFAIYLEYLGRPLGLWRTSMKLMHTLSETLFICAWSAALSLCFDNFFTAIIGCASPSQISWYNQIQRPIPNLPNLGRGNGGPADTICDHQVALICLVGVGLIMYCSNLVISLFRIFEKVKYHPAALPR